MEEKNIIQYYSLKILSKIKYFYFKNKFYLYKWYKKIIMNQQTSSKIKFIQNNKKNYNHLKETL